MTSRAAAGIVPRGLRRSAQTLPDAKRELFYRNIARGGGERLGLLQPLDARPEGSANAGNDGARSGRSQQPALSRRAHDRRAARVPRRSRATPTSRATLRCARPRRGVSALLAAAYEPAIGFFYDVRWRTGERVTRPADARRSGAAVLRARDAGAGARGGRAPRARLPAAGRLRHHADRVGTAVGCAERVAAARVARDRGRARATGAPTSPTRRARGGSRSTAASSARRGR